MTARRALQGTAHVLARRQCETEGHDLEIICAGPDPVQIVCGRGCGHAGWTVTPVLCPPGHLAGPTITAERDDGGR